MEILFKEMLALGDRCGLAVKRAGDNGSSCVKIYERPLEDRDPWEFNSFGEAYCFLMGYFKGMERFKSKED